MCCTQTAKSRLLPIFEHSRIKQTHDTLQKKKKYTVRKIDSSEDYTVNLPREKSLENVLTFHMRRQQIKDTDPLSPSITCRCPSQSTSDMKHGLCVKKTTAITNICFTGGNKIQEKTVLQCYFVRLFRPTVKTQGWPLTSIWSSSNILWGF